MNTTSDTGRLDGIVADWANEHHCPSIVWGVVADGSLAISGATGSVHGVAPTDDTVYRIASMTKSYSTALTLLLRDEGLIRLDEPVAVYAPELATVRGPTSDAAPITVRDLLCMTSGLVTDDAWADRHLDLTDEEFDAAISGGMVFAATPGTTFEYSNFGFALLGRVIHRATGRRLQDLMTTRLLEPLGLSNTTWVQPDHDDWAPPLRWLDDSWSNELPTPGDGLIAPMGGLWTTVRDLATWVAWLADAFPARDGRDDDPLSRSSRRELQTAQRYVGTRTLRGTRMPTAYGYGLRIIDDPAHGPVVAHSGGLPGYGSSMRWSTVTGVGVVAMSNVTYAPMTPLIALLHDELLTHDPPHRPRRTADTVELFGRKLVDLLNRWAGAEQVSADELAALFADNVDPDESFEHRAARTARHGPLTVGQVNAINDARGSIECTTPTGARATIRFALAPTRPHRIQDYEVATAD